MSISSGASNLLIPHPTRPTTTFISFLLEKRIQCYGTLQLIEENHSSTFMWNWCHIINEEGTSDNTKQQHNNTHESIQQFHWMSKYNFFAVVAFTHQCCVFDLQPTNKHPQTLVTFTPHIGGTPYNKEVYGMNTQEGTQRQMQSNGISKYDGASDIQKVRCCCTWEDGNSYRIATAWNTFVTIHKWTPNSYTKEYTNDVNEQYTQQTYTTVPYPDNKMVSIGNKTDLPSDTPTPECCRSSPIIWISQPSLERIKPVLPEAASYCMQDAHPPTLPLIPASCQFISSSELLVGWYLEGTLSTGLFCIYKLYPSCTIPTVVNLLKTTTPFGITFNPLETHIFSSYGYTPSPTTSKPEDSRPTPSDEEEKPSYTCVIEVRNVRQLRSVYRRTSTQCGTIQSTCWSPFKRLTLATITVPFRLEQPGVSNYATIYAFRSGDNQSNKNLLFPPKQSSPLLKRYKKNEIEEKLSIVACCWVSRMCKDSNIKGYGLLCLYNNGCLDVDWDALQLGKPIATFHARSLDGLPAYLSGAHNPFYLPSFTGIGEVQDNELDSKLEAPITNVVASVVESTIYPLPRDPSNIKKSTHIPETLENRISLTDIATPSNQPADYLKKFYFTNMLQQTLMSDCSIGRRLYERLVDGYGRENISIRRLGGIVETETYSGCLSNTSVCNTWSLENEWSANEIASRTLAVADMWCWMEHCMGEAAGSKPEQSELVKRIYERLRSQWISKDKLKMEETANKDVRWFGICDIFKLHPVEDPNFYNSNLSDGDKVAALMHNTLDVVPDRDTMLLGMHYGVETSYRKERVWQTEAQTEIPEGMDFPILYDEQRAHTPTPLAADVSVYDTVYRNEALKILGCTAAANMEGSSLISDADRVISSLMEAQKHHFSHMELKRDYYTSLLWSGILYHRPEILFESPKLLSELFAPLNPPTDVFQDHLGIFFVTAGYLILHTPKYTSADTSRSSNEGRRQATTHRSNQRPATLPVEYSTMLNLLYAQRTYLLSQPLHIWKQLPFGGILRFGVLFLNLLITHIAPSTSNQTPFGRYAAFLNIEAAEGCIGQQIYMQYSEKITKHLDEKISSHFEEELLALLLTAHKDLTPVISYDTSRQVLQYNSTHMVQQQAVVSQLPQTESPHSPPPQRVVQPSSPPRNDVTPQLSDRLTSSISPPILSTWHHLHKQGVDNTAVEHPFSSDIASPLFVSLRYLSSIATRFLSPLKLTYFLMISTQRAMYTGRLDALSIVGVGLKDDNTNYNRFFSSDSCDSDSSQYLTMLHNVGAVPNKEPIDKSMLFNGSRFKEYFSAKDLSGKMNSRFQSWKNNEFDLVESADIIFRRYLDETGDVQTLALLACYGSSMTIPPILATALTIYNDLLFRWNSIESHGSLSVIAARYSGIRSWRFNGNIDSIRCYCCNYPLFSKKDAATYLEAKYQLTFVCPSCNYRLPNCALCLSSISTSKTASSFNATGVAEMDAMKSAFDVEHHTYYGNNAEHHNSTKSNTVDADKWYTFCCKCHHGGCLAHLEEWFDEFDECPVPDCTCFCSALNPLEDA